MTGDDPISAGPVTDESPDTKKKGHGAGSRERRLRALPQWEEIEVRLQHRWTPDRVLEWHARTYPGSPAPARKTLYRFLEDQDESWYVPQLVIDQTDTKRVPPRILVLQKQANLIETQSLRLNKALKKEADVNGHLSPEVRANIELLDRLLHRHFATQQDLGLEPKLTPAGREAKGEGGSADDNAANRALAAVVGRLIELPSEAFIATLGELIGPPPVKQPLKLGEVTVIEKRPLTAEDAAS